MPLASSDRLRMNGDGWARHGCVEAVGEAVGFEGVDAEHGVLGDGDSLGGGAFLAMAARLAILARFSIRTMAKGSGLKGSLRAFWEERALPSGVLGWRLPGWRRRDWGKSASAQV